MTPPHNPEFRSIGSNRKVTHHLNWKCEKPNSQQYGTRMKFGGRAGISPAAMEVMLPLPPIRLLSLPVSQALHKHAVYSAQGEKECLLGLATQVY